MLSFVNDCLAKFTNFTKHFYVLALGLFLAEAIITHLLLLLLLFCGVFFASLHLVESKYQLEALFLHPRCDPLVELVEGHVKALCTCIQLVCLKVAHLVHLGVVELCRKHDHLEELYLSHVIPLFSRNLTAIIRRSALVLRCK